MIWFSTQLRILKSSIPPLMNEEYRVLTRNRSTIRWKFGEPDIGSWLTRKSGDSHKNDDFGSRLVWRRHSLYSSQTIRFLLQIYHLTSPEAINIPTLMAYQVPPYGICTTNQTYIIYICCPEYLQYKTSFEFHLLPLAYSSSTVSKVFAPAVFFA